MWTLPVAGFVWFLGHLLEGVSRRGTPVPAPLRLAPFAFLAVVALGSWAGYEQASALETRPPTRTFQDLEAASQAGFSQALLAGTIRRGQEDLVYSGRSGERAYDLTLELEGGEVLLRSPRVYGERSHYDKVEVPAGVAVLVDGALARYQDGSWFLDEATLYHRSLEEYRQAALGGPWERWAYAAGGAAAVLGLLALLGRAAAGRRPRETAPSQTPQAP